MAININASANFAINSIRKASDEANTSIVRISTGKRVNNGLGTTDTASASVAKWGEAQVRSLDRGAQNALDSSAMFTLFASKGNAIIAHLSRMKELAVQMSNPGWSATQYASANQEYRAHTRNITSIANQGYNGGAIAFAAGGARNINVGRGADIVQTGLLWGVANTATALGSQTLDGPANLNTSALWSAEITKLETAIPAAAGETSAYSALARSLQDIAQGMRAESAAVSAGVGAVQNTDFAAETAKLAAAEIRTQASTAMLSQANTKQQYVLSLLQA
jgi:flagellin|tara:strand:- start:843 stop:1679 length:837 start_codon:yes stop_codon:yes gene_type:complete